MIGKMEEEKKETKKVESKEEVKKEVTAQGKKEDKKTEPVKKETKQKFETKKEDKKKENHSIFIGIAVAIIAIIAIIAIFVMIQETPQKVVEKTLTELKQGAYAEQMLSGILEGEDDFNAEAQKLLFEKLEWKVLNVKEEGNTATVEVEITNKDFKTIMGNCMQKALKAALTGKISNEEDMTNYIMEELKNEEVQPVTTNQSIKVEKQDGKWKVVEGEEFVNCVLPGLYEAVNAFN